MALELTLRLILNNIITRARCFNRRLQKFSAPAPAPRSPLHGPPDTTQQTTAMPHEHPQPQSLQNTTPGKKLTQNNSTCPEVQFFSLSNGHSELIIEHCGQKYRLIATRHGKLVLNK